MFPEALLGQTAPRSKRIFCEHSLEKKPRSIINKVSNKDGQTYCVLCGGYKKSITSWTHQLKTPTHTPTHKKKPERLL